MRAAPGQGKLAFPRQESVHASSPHGAARVASAPASRPRPRATLDIYVIDVEGATPRCSCHRRGESLLIDTGNGGAAATRDADRIMAAAKDAGLTQIDHLITTHYHGDHFGGDGRTSPAAFRSGSSSTTVRASR